jgi:hypothetical protein
MAGDNSSWGDNIYRRLQSFREGGSMIMGGTQRRRTVAAEPGRIRVVRTALGTLDGQANSPSLAWPQINRGMGEKSNLACLRGFEPPTFGSGVPFSILMDIWGKPYFQGEVSCFPLSTFSQN